MHFKRKITKLMAAVLALIITFGNHSYAAELELVDTQIEFIERYHEIAEELSYQYDIPWEAVIAQGIIESASGTSKMARTKNNLFGIAAYDGNTSAATTFDSCEDCFRGYYKIISSSATYAGATDYRSDPYGYIWFIAGRGYASDPNYAKNVSRYISAIEAYAEEQEWASSAYIVADKDLRERLATSGNLASAILSANMYGMSAIEQ